MADVSEMLEPVRRIEAELAAMPQEGGDAMLEQRRAHLKADLAGGASRERSLRQEWEALDAERKYVEAELHTMRAS